MFCADTNSWIAYLAGNPGDDVELLDSHFEELQMAPVVLTELLSSPSLPNATHRALLAIPLLELTPGFWERAGKTRAELVKRKLKADLADTLIAQVCIDHELPLHTRDTDFRPFAKYAGLRLVLHGLVQ